MLIDCIQIWQGGAIPSADFNENGDLQGSLLYKKFMETFRPETLNKVEGFYETQTFAEGWATYGTSQMF